MTPRERVRRLVNRQSVDRIPLDLGSTSCSGISASALSRLRKALGLKEKAVRVIEPFQMLGLVEDDVCKALGVDTVGLWRRMNNMGLANVDWKAWTLMDGTPVEMCGGFAYDSQPDGSVVAYPQGDKSVPPSFKMPKNGYFFDALVRAGPFDEDDLDAVRDYKDQFRVYSDEDARWIENEAKRLYEETDYAIVGHMANGSFGDTAAIYGGGLKRVQGIRSIEDWLVAHILYPDYIHELFDFQLGIYLKNLEIYRQAVGDRIDVLFAQGTDFGMQTGELISPENYRTFYQAPMKAYTDWIHKNTKWKIMLHSCGSVVNLLDLFSESGIDILNPVQCSAKGMDPRMLKEKHGHQFIFWGGGIDTQKTLPFGTEEEVRQEAAGRLEVFGKDGGFVFNTNHNILGGSPVNNILAMYDTFAKHRNY